MKAMQKITTSKEPLLLNLKNILKSELASFLQKGFEIVSVKS